MIVPQSVSTVANGNVHCTWA